VWYEFEKKVWCAVATPQLFCENPNRVLSAEIPFLCRLFLRRLGQHFFFSCPSRSFSHFPPTDTPCHGNKIWNKIGYNSACVRAFFEIFAPIGGGFGDAPSNAANDIFSRPTPVAMATKFGTKLVIARLL